VSENERLYSENQQLIETNELLAIGDQNLQAVQEQLDLAMTQLNRYTHILKTAIQERTDRDSTVHSHMGKLSGYKKAKEQQATQFSLTLGQQNIQIEKLRATLARVCSHEPSGFGPTRDDSVIPWRIIFSQKRRYDKEHLHLCHIFSCYSYTGYEFLRSMMINLPTLSDNSPPFPIPIERI
jgi:hypothetical protein